MTGDNRNRRQRIKAVADAIEAVFKKGVHLTGDVLHYLESTHAIVHPEELLGALLPPFDCDSESICEMVFYPDESQQAFLEPVLEKNPIEDEQEKKVLADMIAARKIGAAIYFPSADRPCRLSIPDAAVHRYIQRINADRRMDPRILEAIGLAIQSPETAAAVKVKLRNARFDFEDYRVASICAFLDGIEENSPDFMDLFVLLCRILETMSADADLFSALMETKHKCLEMIRQAEKTETDLKQNPVEVLMMRGETIAAIDAAQVRTQIDYIDRVALALFGRTGALPTTGQNQGPSVNLWVFRKKGDDLDRLIKIFS